MALSINQIDELAARLTGAERKRSSGKDAAGRKLSKVVVELLPEASAGFRLDIRDAMLAAETVEGAMTIFAETPEAAPVFVAPEITANEHRVLRALVTNEHGNPTWARCIDDAEEPSGLAPAQLGGVVASLNAKGLVVSSGTNGEETISWASDAAFAFARDLPAPETEAPAPEAPIARKQGRGRTSGFAGRRLYATDGAKPRRPGSHGARSLAIIAAEPGISYEDFVARGGRRVDLAWDIAHGKARAE